MSKHPTYRTEFPSFGELDVSIPEGFEDTSWHNDAMPSFSHLLGSEDFDGVRVILWVAEADPAQREFPADMPRFAGHVWDELQGETLDSMESDDWAEVVAWAQAKVRELLDLQTVSLTADETQQLAAVGFSGPVPQMTREGARYEILVQDVEGKRNFCGKTYAPDGTDCDYEFNTRSFAQILIWAKQQGDTAYSWNRRF